MSVKLLLTFAIISVAVAASATGLWLPALADDGSNTTNDGAASQTTFDDSAPQTSFDGTVSWYGPHFNGRKTANGEIFDMNKMTAAHRTLPLPTRVLVENPRNGKSVVVRVNDRGPFVMTRVMDLSRQGAVELDYVSSGTAFVECTVLPADDGAFRLGSDLRGCADDPSHRPDTDSRLVDSAAKP